MVAVPVADRRGGRGDGHQQYRVRPAGECRGGHVGEPVAEWPGEGVPAALLVREDRTAQRTRVRGQRDAARQPRRLGLRPYPLWCRRHERRGALATETTAVLAARLAAGAVGRQNQIDQRGPGTHRSVQEERRGQHRLLAGRG
jgi:hypothetical protein